MGSMTEGDEVPTSDFGLFADREALRELTALYCWYVTRGDAAAVAGLFVANGVFDAPLLEGAGRNVSRGRRAIEARLKDSLKPGRMCPIVANHIIRVSGDHAHGTCVMRNFVGNADGSRSELIGYYRDQYGREAEGWRFIERVWRLYVPSLDVDGEPPV